MTTRDEGLPGAGLSASELPVEAALPGLRAALEGTGAAVLVAPPGAGKTTRVPLALLDAPWRNDGRIIVLEPRRLAARAAARRMAETLGEPVGRTVGYRVRMESKISAATRIEIVTEGVFTQMIVDDPALEGIAAVLFDEAHERSLDGDLGLALAIETRGALRPDLRLVVMSATIEARRFADVLGRVPVVESAGRAFPVETYYRPRAPGGRVEDTMTDAIVAALAEEEGSVLAFLPGQADILRTAERLGPRLAANTDLAPLYGALDPAVQDAAIRPAPAGRRKVVLATSIAETSLTIEGVRIVVDSGLARRPVFEPATGLTRLETVRVSRASADQRRGRAGRTAPGVCIRLWDEGQTAALPPHDRPEILESDLAGLVLDLAAWGVADPATMPFLDPPPAPAWREAADLVRRLDALDAAGRLTAEGERLRRLPLHPRLGHMVLRAAARGEGRLAAEVALLLTERGLGGTDTDLRERLRRFRTERGRRADEGRALARRWLTAADPAAGMGEGGVDPERAGAVLALAFPDRLAEARGAPGRFRLANGRGGVLDPADALAKAPYLAVAELQGAAENARILLAAPIARDEIESDFAERIESGIEIAFDESARAVRARRVRRLDRVVLAEEPIAVPPGETADAAFAAGLARLGLAALPWTAGLVRLRGRLAFLRQTLGEPWPDVSDAVLAAGLRDWLLPYAPGVMRLDGLTPAMLGAALEGLLPSGRGHDLDRHAPPMLETPAGRPAPIDYDRDSPTASVRVQDLFGLDVHPTIADGKVPLVLELLSPAERPIQITRDLPGFWRGSWSAVRADLRGRYPKHSWPEDPVTAPPVRMSRPRG
ncbi:ATP-dependent helicase HrpB [Segnochrobactrum spirostomi]|uniref:ATP-dependent helicase HrpB n=1 Tax=Segnochrobactrum spirostomi TaxID=2608987 RepID=A0A6A7XZC4_9HYPH|nr:ATP-dependent helicase HrpB [Segnochrobactrum spirostomi]MQT11467.1 ATP-dependent helicase HrpB [Segnochrobactrum spirostomi]